MQNTSLVIAAAGSAVLIAIGACTAHSRAGEGAAPPSTAQPKADHPSNGAPIAATGETSVGASAAVAPVKSVHDDSARDAAAHAEKGPGTLDAGADDARVSLANASAPSVRVINIGMHIGGGPNDDVTKEPIHKSVAPHFEEIARCFPASGAPPVDFGVDLTIEANGGKAQVARPRTALRDDAFIGCVVGVFEATEFLPPRFGKTVVSYSLRFIPPKSAGKRL